MRQSSSTSCPSAVGDAKCEAILQLMLDQPFPATSAELAVLEADLPLQIAQMLGTTSDRIIIISLSAGSVVVDFVVAPALQGSAETEQQELEDLFHVLVPSASIPLSFGCDVFACHAGTINSGASDGIKSEQMCCLDSCATWAEANDCNTFFTDPAMIMYNAGGTIAPAQAAAETCCIPDQAQVELVIVIAAAVATTLILCSGGFLGFQSLEQLHPEQAPTIENVVQKLLMQDQTDQHDLSETSSAQANVAPRESLEKAFSDLHTKEGTTKGGALLDDYNDPQFYSQITRPTLHKILDDAGASDLDRKIEIVRELFSTYPMIHSALEPWHIRLKQQAQDKWPMTAAILAISDFYADCTVAFITYASDPIAEANLYFMSLRAWSIMSIFLSLTFGIILLFYFVCFATDGTSHLLDKDKFREGKLLYGLLILISATNPETLVLLPWKDVAAAKMYDGLPSLQAAVFCSAAATLETVPQLAIQIIHINRVLTATRISVGELDFSLKFSIIFGALQFVAGVS
eukprot:COSAG02_NODE_1584_length_11821_cov_11.601604_12_plen_518_part_00